MSEIVASSADVFAAANANSRHDCSGPLCDRWSSRHDLPPCRSIGAELVGDDALRQVSLLPAGVRPPWSCVILTYPVPSYSLRWFEELLPADTWRRSIVNSLIIGGGTTLLATLLEMAASLGLRAQTLLLRGHSAHFSVCQWWCLRWCLVFGCRCFSLDSA